MRKEWVGRTQSAGYRPSGAVVGAEGRGAETARALQAAAAPVGRQTPDPTGRTSQETRVTSPRQRRLPGFRGAAQFAVDTAERTEPTLCPPGLSGARRTGGAPTREATSEKPNCSPRLGTADSPKLRHRGRGKRRRGMRLDSASETRLGGAARAAPPGLCCEA